MAEVLAERVKELNRIKDIPEGEIKDKKNTLFVKEALQREKIWLLILDDAETLVELRSYMPIDAKLGEGGVRITTYNANLVHADFETRQSHSHGSLTKESLELFLRVLNDKRILALDERIKALDFLKHSCVSFRYFYCGRIYQT